MNNISEISLNIISRKYVPVSHGLYGKLLNKELITKSTNPVHKRAILLFLYNRKFLELNLSSIFEIWYINIKDEFSEAAVQRCS